MKAATTSSDHSSMPAASRQSSVRRRSISSSSRSMREGRSDMPGRLKSRPDGGTRFSMQMGRKLHLGPARVPSRDSPEAAVEAVLARGLSAREIDFEGGFWMSYEFAERFGEVAREADVALSVHAPLAEFMGHAERGKKLNMAVGMLDHSAGIAKAAGPEVVVFHPGFLLGRSREAAIDSVCEQLGDLRERLEGKDRAVPFG